jgi:hypothetical protein
VPSRPYEQCATSLQGPCQIPRATPRKETYLATLHLHQTETSRSYSHQYVLAAWTKITALLKQQTTSAQNHPQTALDLWYPTVGHGFHIQHRDPGALPIESPAHDSGRTVVCAEHSYPNTLIRRDLQIPSVKEAISHYSSHYSARLTAHPNGILLTLLEPPERKRLRRHLPNGLPTRFMV